TRDIQLGKLTLYQLSYARSSVANIVKAIPRGNDMGSAGQSCSLALASRRHPERIAGRGSMSGLVRALHYTAALAVGIALAQPLAAATYLPISDAELAQRSPVIVWARVQSQRVVLEAIDSRQMAMTILTFERLETIKGRLSADVFSVRLAGGRA